ncbi:MAG: DUF480 domain-containing protein [Acidobacteria bacterium]|nr:DUF480 domain-containing protein [Acidobacteriota bacterium]
MPPPINEKLLTHNEARVLGCLIEKEATTPDNYPLSLNALTNACNQKSNRDPVIELDEQAVRDALRGLSDLRMAGSTSSADSRVAKYEHSLGEAFNYQRMEYALMCVLLLRGPQTPGELRGRAERLFQFESLDQVHCGLNLLMRREPSQAKVLPRQPGTKESRYAHLLCGDIDVSAWETAVAVSAPVSADAERIVKLEEEVAALRTEVGEMQQQLADFRSQFS